MSLPDILSTVIFTLFILIFIFAICLYAIIYITLPKCVGEESTKLWNSGPTTVVNKLNKFQLVAIIDL